MKEVLQAYEEMLKRYNAFPLVFVAMAEDATMRVMVTPSLREVFMNSAEEGEAIKDFILDSVHKGITKVMEAPLDDLDFV